MVVFLGIHRFDVARVLMVLLNLRWFIILRELSVALQLLHTYDMSMYLYIYTASSRSCLRLGECSGQCPFYALMHRKFTHATHIHLVNLLRWLMYIQKLKLNAFLSGPFKHWYFEKYSSFCWIIMFALYYFYFFLFLLSSNIYFLWYACGFFFSFYFISIIKKKYMLLWYLSLSDFNSRKLKGHVDTTTLYLLHYKAYLSQSS